MALPRSGTGGPAVVFLPGGGMFGRHYWNVHDLVTELTTSVLYERLGTGSSDALDRPRSGTPGTNDWQRPHAVVRAIRDTVPR